MTTVSSPSSQPGGLSALFNLSQAAASAPPIPVVHDTSKALRERESKELLSGKQAHTFKHRRLSSTGQKARRMSDARDAATRPASNNNIHIAASALSSLASLSLSAASSVPAPVSTPSRHTRSRSQLDGQNISFSPISFDANMLLGTMDMNRHHLGALASSVPNPPFTYAASVGGDDIEVDVEDDLDDSASVVEGAMDHGDKKSKKDNRDGKSGKGKKRGTIFKCESCSKVYRHPSCLVKHRWEHSPHWREASKFLLSKHQQVQLLEAAAILTHLDPGSSLPEDRSLWPSYLSGGLLPPPSSANTIPGKDGSARSLAGYPAGSSVPNRPIAPRMGRARSGSIGAGPRMHDYKVQGGITQIRPGVLAHPTSAPSTVVPPGASISPYANEERGTTPPLRQVKEELFALSITSPSKPEPMAVPITSMNGTNKDRDRARTSGNAMFGANYAGSYVENGFTEYREGGMPGSAFSAVSFDSSALSGSLAHSASWSLPRSDLRSGSVVSGDDDQEEEEDRDYGILSASPGLEDKNDEDEVSSGSKSGSVPPSSRSIGAYGSYGTFGSSYESYGSRASPDDQPEYDFPSGGFSRRIGERDWKKVHEEESRSMVVREEDEWEGMAVDMDL